LPGKVLNIIQGLSHHGLAIHTEENIAVLQYASSRYQCHVRTMIQEVACMRTARSGLNSSYNHSLGIGFELDAKALVAAAYNSRTLDIQPK
jgi:hypothetical protein